MKKIVCFMIVVIFTSVFFSESISASDDRISTQLGFSISEQDYGQFGYIIERRFSSFYNEKTAGTTIYSFVYCRGKKKVLNKNEDICCINIKTEPGTIQLKEKYLIFLTKNKDYKFGISSLQVTSDKTWYSNFCLNNLIYRTTADAVVSQESESGEFSFGITPFDIGTSITETKTKSLVDVSNKSTMTKMDINFIFGSADTVEQKERVYGQTQYYIIQQYISNRNSYTNITSIKPIYKCGNKVASNGVSIKTEIGFD